MAKIFYSMSGEGRGHATRVRAVVEQLRGEHEIVLYAPSDAYALLAPVYQETEVVVRRIPCLHFSYTNKRLNPFTTAKDAVGYLWRLPRLVAAMRRDIEREQPDLAVTDFEPALPRAARQCGLPFISLDHQHFLVYSDLSSLPRGLRARAWLWGQTVRHFYSGQAETIVSSFFAPPLVRDLRTQVTQIGVLLRPEILAARRANDGHLLVYLRKFASPALFEALRRVGRPVRVYGLGERPPEGDFRFLAIDQRRFLDDLASCEALVTTAGNQVVGESLYLGKPVLAMPESNNHEQYINAHFLRQSGAGDWVELESIAVEQVRRFLGRLDEFRSRIDVEWLNGNPAALSAIRRHLPKTASAVAKPPNSAALAAG